MVYLGAKPVKQKLRRFSNEKKEAIRAEVVRLLVAYFIREVFHPYWLTNLELVLKKNNKESNKHCLKDLFGSPRINQDVDSTAGCALLSFLNCYLGYHQIALAPEDQEKTSYITSYGAYCYNTMSFGLKNTGTTYQQSIQACLAKQWDKNDEAFVDDVVIKTRDPDDFIEDMEETFSNLRVYRWKLNPDKCVFGVPSGKILGFIVSNCGIEANPEKKSAITCMRPLTSQKQVQKLTGCMAARSRFI